MDMNAQAQNEISLTDIFKIILRKIKIVLLALLGGILIGVALGAITTADKDYYGTSAEFYVNPIKIDGATDEPSSSTDDSYNVYGAYGKHIMDNMVKLLSSDVFAETLALGGSELPQKGISKALDEAIEKAEQDNTPESKKAALLEWRKTNNYKVIVSAIKSSVSYSYIEGSTKEADSLAKSFIYVKISVLNNKNFATSLYERIKLCLPEFVSVWMPVPDGKDAEGNRLYNATNCVLISTLASVRHTNPTAEKDAIVKNAIIFGLLSVVLACVVVVIVSVSDKRLINYEATMDKFGVPVLGVIPTIAIEEKKTVEGEEKNAEV